MSTRLSEFIKANWGIILAGIIIGILAPLLQKLGNPAQTGLCIACFERDLAGALGFHRAEGGQYIRPEIIGLVLGSTLAALIFGEFKTRGGSGSMIRFFLGMFAMIGCLSFLGCPVGVLLRLGTGNLNAVPALLGIVCGIFIGIRFIKAGFFIGRSRKLSSTAGWIMPVFMIALFVFLFFDFRSNDWSAPFSSWLPPAAIHAPLFVSLAIGLIIGFFAQRTRFCAIGAFRDLIIVRNSHYMYGIIAMVVSSFLTNLLLGQVNIYFGSQEQGHSLTLFTYFWPFLGMVLAGLCFSLVEGCAARQLFLTGEGDSDAGFFILGMFAGAALTHNFGFIGRPVCAQVMDISSLGIGTIIIGLIFCITIGFTMRIKNGGGE
ncbi:MAG: YedE-related selenium metabolism membrane protein [Spirochaetales bacterium]|nr:YedE-related selenium metabolism membrane protein [Spirochaetales bacterium]